jgi:UDP-N-acetylmuramyl pentapeptide phosphotransferase/UDP-N-acetylglucosamine-1-phosphate transferase
MPFSPRTLLAVAASFVLALLLTPLVRAFARRYGFVAAPKSDRWHKKPTAMLGGAVIWKRLTESSSCSRALSYFSSGSSTTFFTSSRTRN